MISSSRWRRPTRPTTKKTRRCGRSLPLPPLAAVGGGALLALVLGGCPANRPAAHPPALSPVEVEGAGQSNRPDAKTAARLLADGRQPAGGTCSAGADCLSGLCEGIGCGEAFPGVCVAAERPCGEDKVVFCSCEGVEFSAPSSCPGQRFQNRGTCRPEK